MKSSNGSSSNSEGALLLGLMSELITCIQAGMSLHQVQEQVSNLQSRVEGLYKLYSEILEKVTELSRYV